MAAMTWSAAAAEELRADAGRHQKSNKAIARESGMTEASVSRKLKGLREITLDELAAMSAAVETTPGDLIARAEQRMEEAA